jgi:uncharacterized membrane protein
MEWIRRLDISRVRIALFATVLGGALLRLYDIGADSVWVDEGWSISFANQSLPRIIELTARDVHPPLYYLVLRYWVDLAGMSEAGIRSLSAVFGVLAIVALYAVGAVLFNQRTGLFAAILLAVSPFAIRFAQMARMYSLLLLLSLVSFYYFLALVRRDEGSLGYVISSGLLLYTHAFAVSLIVVQNLYILTVIATGESNQTLREWLPIQALLAVLYSPWIVVLLSQYQRYSTTHEFYAAPTTGDLMRTFISQAGGSKLFLLFIMMGSVVIIGFYPYVNQPNLTYLSKIRSLVQQVRLTDLRETYLLLIWWLLPVVIPFAIATLMSPFYAQRYTIGGFGAFLLLVARGLDKLRSRYVWVIPVVVILGLTVTGPLSGYYQFQNTEKEQWNEAGEYINMNAEPGDLIVMNSGERGSRSALKFYLDRQDISIRAFPSPNSRRVDDSNIGELAPMIDGNGRFWLLLSHSRDCEGLLIEQASEEFTLVERQVFARIDLYLFSVSASQPGLDISETWPSKAALTGC